jgi:hypothetical protein
MVVLGKTSSGNFITAFIDQDNNNLHIATVNPAGSFSDSTVFANVFNLYVADLNGDGLNDLIVSGIVSGDGFADVFLSHGDGTFAAPMQIATGQIAGLAVDDFNGDGKPDVEVLYYSFPGFGLRFSFLPARVTAHLPLQLSV